MVSITILVLLLSTDSLEYIYYVGFGIFNAIFCKVLKEMIKQPRPFQSKKSGYGMPSSHTSSITYFLLVFWFVGSEYIKHPFCRLLVTLLATVYGSLACYWRVQAGYHTLSQILVGATNGLVFGTLAIYLPIIISLKTSPELNFKFIFISKIFLIFIGGVVIFKKSIKRLISKRNVS